MIRAYHPERPSLWRDVRAIPFNWHGLPMLAAFAVVLVWAVLGWSVS